MELKDYQSTVLADLSTYLQTLSNCEGRLNEAFTGFWQDKGVLNQKYKNTIQRVPHVCVKVPTAGGKTFIAVNALERIFTAFAQYRPNKPKFVLWLVPSLTILEQTVKNLSDIDHPYRQRLNDLFQGRVQIYQKSDVLLGAGFNADTIRGQLSIVVMSFDSLKTNSKENRKAYQENGYLASFLGDTSRDNVLLPEYDKSSLINVIRTLSPVVVVDESHNAETVLSVDMLENLNPSFIFDLTATPRNNSNIISYVDALSLKNKNMVKLPVIVANQRNQENVITAALNMRRQLEIFADEAQTKGGNYIRPIVLFQAEPKNKDDTTTFEKVKQTLLDLNIPKEHIAIKTANINELKNVDLLSPNCPIRYIITINALKEGWDCPFAYILATLANKSSVIDVTQILGRILRMPYTRKHSTEILNLSYVFTASDKFQDTLSQVVNGLNKAGFSKRDYREVDLTNTPIDTPEAPSGNQDTEATSTTGLFQSNNDPTPESKASADLTFDPTKLDPNWETHAIEQARQHTNQDNDTAAPEATSIDTASDVERIKAQAIQQARAFESQAEHTDPQACPQELEADMNQHKLKPIFEESAAGIMLPQFFLKVPESKGFFDDEWQQLKHENLLLNFALGNLDATVDFTAAESEMYEVDAQNIGKDKTGREESSPDFKPMNFSERQKLNQIIKAQTPSGQVTTIVGQLFALMGKKAFYPIDDADIKKYLRRIVDDLTADQRDKCLDNIEQHAEVIKHKIRGLMNESAQKQFEPWLTAQKVKLQPNFPFPKSITPSKNAPAIAKSLYITEGDINGLESQVIRGIAALENVMWWHRNLGPGKGFAINGFINHYPDFIILTQRNHIIVLETKGDDRDNSDSMYKLKLGRLWAHQANELTHKTGYHYSYMMVFDKNSIDGSMSISDALKLIKEL